MSTISRSSFYGSSNKTALRKRKIIEKTLNGKVKEFIQNSIPEKYKQRITGPINDWKLFYRQQSAFNYAREQSEELHVFAFESSSLGQGGGKRMYLVSSYEVFWHYYSQLPCEKKLHYEIIPEGAVCKLYFDLEFSIPDNPNKVGTKMVDTFVQYVCLWLDLEFHVKCTRKDVLDLDASTDKKFSRHLIFLPPDTAFQDNIRVGNFVQYIMKALHQYCENRTNPKRMRDSSLDDNKTVVASFCEDDMNGKEKEIGELPYKLPSITGDSSFIASKEQPPESQNKIIGIQMTNRKEIANETVHVENSRYCETPDKKVEKQQILDNIFTYFTEEQLSSLFVKNKNGERTAFCDLGVYTKNRNFHLYQSSKYGKNNPLVVASDNEFVPSTCIPYSEKSVFMQSLISNVKFSSRMRILKFDSMQKDGLRLVNKNTTSMASLEGYKTSPYPEVDTFIVKHVQEIEPRGGIRQWTYFGQGELLVYEMANYRFCHNIHRSHHSNNIMFIVDLKRKIYYQKCHDPVCRSQNFKSLDFPLPQSVFPSYLWEDDPMFDGEDDDLCSAADEAERTKPG